MKEEEKTGAERSDIFEDRYLGKTTLRKARQQNKKKQRRQREAKSEDSQTSKERQEKIRLHKSRKVKHKNRDERD